MVRYINARIDKNRDCS